MIDTGLRHAQRLQRTSVGLVTIPPFTMELLMHHARRPSHVIILQSFARPPTQHPSSSSGEVRLTTLSVDQFRHHGCHSSELFRKTRYAGVMPVCTACHWLPATERATKPLSPFAEPITISIRYSLPRRPRGIRCLCFYLCPSGLNLCVGGLCWKYPRPKSHALCIKRIVEIYRHLVVVIIIVKLKSIRDG